VLRLHVQINFTCFMYSYSVSFDVKEEISVPMIYNVYVLNVRVQWPDEGSIVEPQLGAIKNFQFISIQFIQSILSNSWHWIRQTEFKIHTKILKTQFTSHINTLKRQLTIQIYTLKAQIKSSTIKYNTLYNTALISILIKMGKDDQW